MIKSFFIAFIIVGVLLALLALFVSIFKRKSVGEVDVTFNHIYNNKNLKRIMSNSAESGKYNSPFIEAKSMDDKIRQGIKIISDNGVIYKKGNNYDCKPKW